MFHVPKLMLTGKILVEFSRKPMNIVYQNINLIKSILKKYINK
jgi:hypothetical protein